MLGPAMCLLTVLTTALVLLAQQVVSKNSMPGSSHVPSHHSHYHCSGPIGLAACKSLHVRSSHIHSHCPHFHSNLDGSIACE